MSMDRDPNVYNTGNTGPRVYDRERRSGGTLPYLIGGLVVALALLAFFFVPWGNNSPEVSTTGSVNSDRPAATAPATPGPAAPTTPATPARPANPQ